MTAQVVIVLPTLEQSLDVVELASVVLLPEVLRLLGQVFTLRKRVALVGDKVRGDGVELGHERREVDGWRRRQRLDLRV
jgi:DNA integrity scanning protein DisA with diadenylate cyclase activity